MKALIKLALAALLAFGSIAANATTIKLLWVFTDEAVTYLNAILKTPATFASEQTGRMNNVLYSSGITNTVSAGSSVLYGNVIAMGSFTAFPPANTSSILDIALQNFAIAKERTATQSDVIMLVTYEPVKGSAAQALPAAWYNAITAIEVVHTNPTSGDFVYSAAHEFGHLLGAKHQDTGGNDANDNTGGSSHGGYFRDTDETIPTSSGSGGNSGWHWYNYCARDVMAYPNISSYVSGVTCNSTTPGISQPTEYELPWYSGPSTSGFLRYKKAGTWGACPGLNCGFFYESGSVVTDVWYTPLGDSTTHNAAGTVASSFAGAANFHTSDLSQGYYVSNIISLIQKYFFGMIFP